MAKSKKNSNALAIIVIVVLVAVVALVIASMATRNNDKDYKEINPLFTRGALNEEGVEVKETDKLVTMSFFKCRGLKITLEKEAELTYEVFYYDEDKQFIESTGALEEDYEGAVPDEAIYAKIVITPQLEKEDQIPLLDIAKISKKLTISVSTDQEVVLATFDFGENKTQEDLAPAADETPTLHSDGTAVTEVLKFVDGNYKLTIENPEYLYKNAFDAKGNSCLKLGSANSMGSFSFTVPSNVSTVIVYVAAYKDKTTKVSANLGKIQDIDTLSNDGEYTAIEIKVPLNHKITIATATGGTRAMIDRIVFIGKA